MILKLLFRNEDVGQAGMCKVYGALAIDAFILLVVALTIRR